MCVPSGDVYCLDAAQIFGLIKRKTGRQELDLKMVELLSRGGVDSVKDYVSPVFGWFDS